MTGPGTLSQLRARLVRAWHRVAQRLGRLATLWMRRRPLPVPEPAPSPAPPAPPPLRAVVSVVIPALNEQARIAEVVRHALADPATAEVIVIDDSSIDETAARAAAAGARVLTSSLLGKGASMKDGLDAARSDLVAYLDGDLTGLRDGLIGDLARPLVDGSADFVKARFGRGAGRVTELTAKPMLKVFFPELAHLAQPLGGIIAARAGLLRQLRFEDGYGVDIGLVIDALHHGARVSEVDIGRLEHDSQSLEDLAAMAIEVSRVIHGRAREAGRLHVEQINAMYEAQRQATTSVGSIARRRRGRTRLLLMDMDGTLTPLRYVRELAMQTGREAALETVLDAGEDEERMRRIAGLFRFVHREQFERVARGLPLRPGAIGFVNRMRRAGFMVGIVSDSWDTAAEIVRKRVFADFALAHTLLFRDEVCTGELRLQPAFLGPEGGPSLDKRHVVDHLAAADGDPAPFVDVWAIGDNLNDLGLLRHAHRAFIIDPKSPRLRHIPGVTEVTDFEALARHIDDEGWLHAA